MGKRIAFSNGRCLVNDVIRIAKKFPSAAFWGDFDAGSVARLRRLTRPKISWNVLYMKAYAKVAMQYPQLRQCYMGFPWPYLYQHQRNVCMLTLSREHQGEERLLFARFNNPESESLTDLQARYDYLRHAPIEEIKQFRHQVNFAKVPALLRRFGWWVMLNLWPETRCGQVGTFGMSISGYKGVYGNQHLGPMTTILGVDPVPRKGVSRILLTFDHRVLDGVPATEIMHQLHVTLTTEIRDELAEIIGVDPITGKSMESGPPVHSYSNQRNQVA
jgi:hypothetical protein